MPLMLPAIIGGIGLFILGMILMTEGLRTLAGDALRAVLERFVRGPLSGLGWGAGITAIVQSSSATTLMTIGFVSAGLLTFPQSIGVIFGANIGTTSTGWIVSTIGLQFKMSEVALPVLGIGVVTRLIGGERFAPLGTAVAGFALIFIGIDTLQGGMQTLAARIDPATFPGLSPLGVPLLLVIGAVMTVVMQSSSAAVATTLAAVHAEAVSLDQAALLVIGQNVGTSVKAVLASIGASVPAKHTALSHILFNVITAAMALALLPVFLVVARSITETDAVALAGFHTAFNIIGVVVLLPFTGRFANLVMRLVPEPAPSMTRHLDPSVIEIPAVASEAARRALIEIAREATVTLRQRLDGSESRAETLQRITALDHALAESQRFLSRLASTSAGEAMYERQLSSLHAADHLSRLFNALRGDRSIRFVAQHESLERLANELVEEAMQTFDHLLSGAADETGERLGELSANVAQVRRRGRKDLLDRTATGAISPHESAQQLEAHLWLDRVAYHLWRSAHHLGRVPEVKIDSSEERE